MSTLHLATSEQESTAVTRLISEQTERTGALTMLVAALRGAVEGSDSGQATTARAELVVWARTALLPHLSAREMALYPAAVSNDLARALIEVLRGNTARIVSLVEALEVASNPVQAVGHASALEALFSVHAEAEQEHILPLLAQTSGVSLAEMAAELQKQEDQVRKNSPVPAEEEDSGGGHSCGCGGHDDPGLPELDARAVPHAIRHATVFGALDAVGPGSGLILVAPHDPLPLLAQIEDRWPGVFTVEYVQRGPETWKLSFVR